MINLIYYCEDTMEFKIGIYFDDFWNLIENNKNKKILIHCRAGMSRSAALVISYLIKKRFYETTPKNAVKYNAFGKVKKIRSCIYPNEGFLQELVDYQNKLYNLFNKK